LEPPQPAAAKQANRTPQTEIDRKTRRAVIMCKLKSELEPRNFAATILTNGPAKRNLETIEERLCF
jgi:hypothetical protein